MQGGGEREREIAALLAVTNLNVRPQRQCEENGNIILKVDLAFLNFFWFVSSIFVKCESQADPGMCDNRVQETINYVITQSGRKEKHDSNVREAEAQRDSSRQELDRHRRLRPLPLGGGNAPIMRHQPPSIFDEQKEVRRYSEASVLQGPNISCKTSSSSAVKPFVLKIL